MVITTDVELRGSHWGKVIEAMKGEIFETQWGIYAISVAIGIMHDQQAIPTDTDEDLPKYYIPRTVLNKGANESMLDLMFQTAILTTKTVEMDEKMRLELAFGDENTTDFKRMHLLNGFANYGVQNLAEQISESNETLETMNSLSKFIEDTMKYLNIASNEDDIMDDWILKDEE